jgi:hypothetical protein
MGPPPPTDRDEGDGFINLSYGEDWLAAQIERRRKGEASAPHVDPPPAATVAQQSPPPCQLSDEWRSGGGGGGEVRFCRYRFCATVFAS